LTIRLAAAGTQYKLSDTSKANLMTTAGGNGDNNIQPVKKRMFFNAGNFIIVIVGK
jgi:hypothetical protein